MMSGNSALFLVGQREYSDGYAMREICAMVIILQDS